MPLQRRTQLLWVTSAEQEQVQMYYGSGTGGRCCTWAGQTLHVYSPWLCYSPNGSNVYGGSGRCLKVVESCYSCSRPIQFHLFIQFCCIMYHSSHSAQRQTDGRTDGQTDRRQYYANRLAFSTIG